MRCLDLTLPGPADNLALDEALLLQAEEGGDEVLRLWEWPQSVVVLGSGAKLAEDVDEAACRGEEIPILRRSSGGGTVLLGTGCLCFSVVLRYDRHQALGEIRSSYPYILDRLLSAFALPGLALAGTSDLVLAGRKFSGNAQQRKRHHLLHHGTLLYAFDLARVSRYLRMPPRQPEYRATRQHEDFLVNLPVERNWLISRIRLAWEADRDETAWPQERTRQLVREKYSLPEWNHRR